MYILTSGQLTRHVQPDRVLIKYRLRKQEEQQLFQLRFVCYCLDLYGTKENEQLVLFACDYQSYVFSISPTLKYD